MFKVDRSRRADSMTLNKRSGFISSTSLKRMVAISHLYPSPVVSRGLLALYASPTTPSPHCTNVKAHLNQPDDQHVSVMMNSSTTEIRTNLKAFLIMIN